MQTVRKLENTDFSEYFRVLESAYPQFKTSIRQDFFDFAVATPGLDHFGLERNGVVEGLYRCFRFEINAAGRMLPLAGIGAVAVDAIYKRDHVCLEMIRHYHQAALDEGRRISALYPFNSAFYRKMGYGFGTRMYSFRIASGNLRRYPGASRLRYLKTDEIGILIDYHKRKVLERHGMICKIPQLMKFIADNDMMRFRYAILEESGEIRAYIAFAFGEPLEGSPFAYDMEIFDMQWDRREDLWALLDFAASQSQQVRNLIFKTPDEDFFFAFNELGDTDIPQRIFGPGTGLSEHAHGMMYRILDLKGLMKDFSEGRFGKGSLRLRLSIHDDLIPANSGDFTYEFDDGAASPTENAPHATLKMNIADFSSLLMAAVSLKRLYELKLAELDRPDLLQKADSIFSYPTKPVSWTTF